MTERPGLPEATRGESENEKTRTWRGYWSKYIESEKPPVEVLSPLFRRLHLLSSPLGRLCKTLQEPDVPPRANCPKTRGDDLLPMDLQAVEKFLEEENSQVCDVVQLMVVCLNYLWLGGRDMDSHRPTATGLSKGQRVAVSPLTARVRDLGSVERTCPGLADARAQLVEARFDYGGEPIMALEELKADQVVPVWPAVGESAVLPVVDFLPEDLRRYLDDPKTCLLPVEEWPRRAPRSKVRATQEEWNKIVSAAAARGIMVGVDEDDVFCDQHGNKVLNGAAGVRKLKKVGGELKTMQRFISNLIPVNSYQTHLSGGDRHLPYLGQLTLLQQEEDDVFVIDSEDFSSCFNLFRLPSSWYPYMCFGMKVDAKIFGGQPGKQVFPSMAVVPMGWCNSVSVIQSVVRTLVFDEAGIPEDSEVSKLKKMPEVDDLSVIYLDSYDELRRLDRHCAEVLLGRTSSRHEKFVQLCAEKGLPLNEGKRVVSCLRGTLQGGELQGDLGWYKLAGDKQVNLIGLGSCLLGIPEWHEFALRHFFGKAVFGMCFRRVLLSVLQEGFHFLSDLIRARGPLAPTAASMDEVIMTIALTALMGTSLKARLDMNMYCSDASPTGGGVCIATHFMPEPWTENHDGQRCWVCEGPLEPGLSFGCPALCRVALCSLECVMAHRYGTAPSRKVCVRSCMALPRFGERFAGKHARLTEAVAMVGTVDVQPPYDWHLGHDFFTPEGKEHLEGLMTDPLLAAEHWAPCCKLFSMARGRPITLEDGTTIAGPQPVRDHRNLMGFKSVPTSMKVRLRHSNQMALKSLKALEEAPRSHLYESCEHPYNSWMWEFTVAKKLLENGYLQSVGSFCCFGGERTKWYEFRNNMPKVHALLNRECPGHDNLKPYTVTRDEDGHLVYDTGKEEEYPWALCKAYAQGLKEQLLEDGHFGRLYHQQRIRWYAEDLALSTERLANPAVRDAAAEQLAMWEAAMIPAEEGIHLRRLLAMASYRGTDVRAYVTLDEGDEQRHEVPYPALRWKWKPIMSFPREHEGHINELEMATVIALLKHRARSANLHHCRWFLVVDSMVTRGALAKGRSPARRLNRLLRRSAATQLASDSYLFPLWTISRWNFADGPSRRFEK